MKYFLGEQLKVTDLASLNYDEFPNILDIKFIFNKRFKDINQFKT